MSSHLKTVSTKSRLAEREKPRQSVVMHQRWEELLFLHWPVDPSFVANGLPPGLRADIFEGCAWIGVVPFSMQNVRPRFLPAVPGISNFLELNLRTYVVDERGRPGVWFYSLDTPKRLPNWIARTFFHLNYRLARMRLARDGDRLHYRSELRMEGGWDMPQDYEWAREGSPFLAEPGSLEFFLVERYRLFACDLRRSRLLTGRVHHEPYPLQRVKLNSYTTRLFSSNGLSEPGESPVSALASSGVDVDIFPMAAVN